MYASNITTNPNQAEDTLCSRYQHATTTTYMQPPIHTAYYKTNKMGCKFRSSKNGLLYCLYICPAFASHHPA